jgi:peptide deformylase
MSLLPIRIYGDPVLRVKTRPVGPVTSDVREFVRHMAEAMFDAPGIGLAAPQVGDSRRIFVVDPDLGEGDENDRRVIAFIDPEITKHSTERVVIEEGCLSIPDIRIDVDRPEGIQVEYTDTSGERQTMDADGMLARVIMHEYDHLDGILFTDRVSPVHRRLVSGELKEMARSQKRERVAV